MPKNTASQETYRLALRLRSMLDVGEVKAALGDEDAQDYQEVLEKLMDRMPVSGDLANRREDWT
jgi:chorismate mutase